MRARILIIGDIMARPGRRAIAQVLPLWKEELGWDPASDVLIGNVENLAHGKGITPNTIAELEELGFDAYTSGNHIFATGPHAQDCFDKYNKIIRPANYLSVSETDRTVPGDGYYRFAKNGQQFLVINLGGRLFFENQFRGEIANPFFAFDEIYKQQAQKDDIIIVDLHAEATSEKNAFGWHADGRASVVYGTHTHIPTADTKILPKGTAYQTDIGFSGARDSVLGVKIENSLAPFLETGKFKLEAPEGGPAVVNALLVELEGAKPVRVERLQKEVEV